jgi:hypothetical protein
VYDVDMQQLEPPEIEAIWKIENEWTRHACAEILGTLLSRRFGAITDDLLEGLWHLSSAQVTDMIEALPGFKSLDDAGIWIANHASH